MKVPFKWLKEYVDIDLRPAELAGKITLAGFETLATPVGKGNWTNVFVGQIVAVNPHPNADRLHLPTVDLGTEKQSVVCGAPNLKVGDKIAFARVGAELIDGHTGQLSRLKPAQIRGIESSGMVCSEKELGISDNHTEILVLPPDAPVGTPLAEYLGDYILDLEVTPNRPDCLCVIGVAREAAALTGKTVKIPDIRYEETDAPIGKYISVEITDPDLCARYCATLITGVKIGESPAWMQQRLQQCGMRPINNVVDVTNYVMLEYGQPLHAFDYELIAGKKIIVRRAKPGEKLMSLDGVERTLSNDMLVIADAGRAVAIAGIMGGANSEVGKSTTTILLESANFNAASIHYTGAKLGLPSEARLRFERGIQPGMTIPAIERATQLIIQTAGGKAAKGMADAYPGRKEPTPLILTTDLVKKNLGIEYSVDQIMSTLTSLGFECKPTSATEISAVPPYWRGDVNLPIDLVEEVARIIGYDKLPTTMLSGPVPPQNPKPIVGLKEDLRSSLANFGFNEVINFTLIGADLMNKMMPDPHPIEPAPLRLLNPMTAELELLRPTLRPGLLAMLATNRRHEEGRVRLFELGRVYIRRTNDLPDEPEMLCGVMSSASVNKVWLDDSAPFDFFDAKGAVEGLLKHLDIEVSYLPGNDESLHPANQAAIVANGSKVGVVGEVHPKVLAAFDIVEHAYLFEIKVNNLVPFATGLKRYQPIPRFPAIVRDLALVLDEKVTHQQVLDVLKSYPLVAQAAIFDVYSGKQVPPGKKSLAYRIVYQSPTQTLTEDEVNGVQDKILMRLNKQFGAVLRT